MHQDTDPFVEVSDEEIENFKFRNALHLLETPQDKMYYLLPKCELLSYWCKTNNKSFKEVVWFGASYVKIPINEMQTRNVGL